MAKEIDLEQIQESPHLLDMLLQMEDVLDSLDIYVFENWYKGVVVEGPGVRRYWLDFTLQYDYDKMPDPKAAMRLIKHGIRVDFSKGTLKTKDYAEQARDRHGEDGAPVQEGDIEEPKDDPENTVWLVAISIPRRLVAQMSSEQIDSEYEDEVEIDDVDDAKDTGIDDESAYMSGEDGQDGTGAPEGADPLADPNAPAPGPQGAPR